MNQNQNASIAAAVSGERQEIDSPAGRLSYYFALPEQSTNEPPLLLIHTVNAAASAHEVKPLYEHYRNSRAVYAPDLPGYGFSDRSERPYLPRLMTDAIHAMVREISLRHGERPIDALAVSLSCEFLARAAADSPESFRTIAMVSPTGFDRRGPFEGEHETNRGLRGLHRVLTLKAIGQRLFNLLTSRRSVRFFLQRTWGGKQIDEEMAEYAHLTARHPDAMNAPFWFLSGFLFSADISRVYRSLKVPVWMAHGIRGEFADFRGKSDIQSQSNWHIEVFKTGALPYFEQLNSFTEAYDDFRTQVMAA